MRPNVQPPSVKSYVTSFMRFGSRVHLISRTRLLGDIIEYLKTKIGFCCFPDESTNINLILHTVGFWKVCAYCDTFYNASL